MVAGTGTPTPGASPMPGSTPMPSPTPGAGAPPPQAGGGNPLQAIIAKLASLFSNATAPIQGPQFTPASDVERLNPQGTPMPTPGPSPTMTPGPGPSPTPTNSEILQRMGAKPSPLSAPKLADKDKRIGGNEMTGHGAGVMGEGKGFAKIKQKNPMAKTAKA